MEISTILIIIASSTMFLKFEFLFINKKNNFFKSSIKFQKNFIIKRMCGIDFINLKKHCSS